MKIGIAVDNTIALHTRSFIEFFRKHSKKIECEALTSKLHFKSREIEYGKAVKELSPSLLNEMKNFELSLLITTIPYANNYFYSGAAEVFILSLADWHELTTLPMSNGIAYMLCEMIVGLKGIGEDHNENTGCINDFLWDKKGIDVGMRAAFICDRCRSKSHSNEYLATQEFMELVAILDAVSSASRRGADILLEPVMAQVEAVSLSTFMCHNSLDKPLVRQLNDTLKLANISTWFDEEKIEPGQVWQDVLERTIGSIGCCLVIAGDSGF